MRFTFVQTGQFCTDVKRLRLTDEDVRAIEQLIMDRPSAGAVMRGTGGLRKIRFAPRSWNVGRSGATRVCYVVFEEVDWCYLVTIFGKNEKPNLSKSEMIALRKWVEATERYLRNG